MRVLIVPIGSHGDVHPYMGVGSALKKRGHEVIVITGAHWQTLATKLGLGFHGFGSADDFEAVLKHPDLWHPRRAGRVVLKFVVELTIRPVFNAILELYKPGETVIVGSTLAIGARAAQEKLNAPMATCHLAPSNLLSAYRAPKLTGFYVPPWMPVIGKRLLWRLATLISDPAFKGLNDLLREHDLPRARRIITHWWHSPTRVIGMFPEWFGPPQPDWPSQMRLTGFPMFDEGGTRETPRELEDFLSAGDAPIVFTPGSAMAQGEKFFRESVAACKLLGRRGILLSQFTETIPEDLPETVRHFEYIPFSKVLPRASALVSHGGIGTTAQALRAGIPHLVQYLAHDQLDNASRLEELGVGDEIAAKRYRADRAAAKLKHLLESNEVSRSCKEAAQRFNGIDPIADTCKLIEEIL